MTPLNGLASDHLGSTSVLSDALSVLTDLGFTGQRLDRSTSGLMYYGARYYLPGLRRFISADV